MTGTRSAALALCLLLTSAVPAWAQRWTIVTSETLTVIGDDSPRTLRDIATELEQFREVLGGVFRDAGRTPSLPTVVYVFSSSSRMKPYLPIHDGKVWSAAGLAMSDGDSNRILMTTEFREASSRIAFHEYTHLLTAGTGRRFPSWLNEGFAEYFSTYQLMDGGRTADIGRPLERAAYLLRERWQPLTDVIGGAVNTHHESDERTVFYPQAWALVHYLMTEMPNGAAAINRYIQLVDGGADSDAAFATAFGQSIASIEEKLRLYVRRDIFMARRYRFTDKVIARAPAAPRTLSPAEADAWLGDLQLAVQRAEGPPRIEGASASAPDSAIAQLALGRLRASQGRAPEALDALTRAAQLAPDDYLVQWSNAYMRLNMDLLGSDIGTIDALQRIAAMRPDSAEAQVMFARRAQRHPERRAAAREAYARAFELAPARLDYKLLYADMLMAEGNSAVAVSLYRGLAQQRDDAAVAREARTIVERFDAFAAAQKRAADAAALAAAGPEVTPAPGASSAVSTQPLRLGGSLGTVGSERESLRSLRDQRLTFQLRRVGPNEERLFGRLTRVECRENGEVRFHFTAEGRALIAAVASMASVELAQYRGQGESMLTCGERRPADPAFVTWRKDRSGQGIVGTAVAVEFMPDDFLP